MILRGVRWFDSVKMVFYPREDFWIEDGLIKAIGQGFDKPGREVVDLQGMLLLPGWIDAHIHITLSGEKDPLITWKKDGIILSTVKGVNYLHNYLKSGVVALRDLGGDGDIALGLKRALKEKVITGPALITAGKALTMTGGHLYEISKEVDGRDEVCKGAREELKKGVDLLKVIATGGILTLGVNPGCSQLSEEEIKIAVEEAKKVQKKVSVHVEGREGIINSLRAGADTIEHGVGLDVEGISLMKLKSVPLIPTLAAPRLIIRHHNELPREMVNKAEEVVEEHRASFALAYRHGCKIAVGTDAGTPFNRHGDYYLELEELLKEGMKIEELLQAASLNGSSVLGFDEKWGNIAEGKVANLTIIEDCLHEKEWYRKVRAVIFDGKIWYNN